MSLIYAREIIWNDIIHHVKEIWNHMLVMAKEKIIVRDLKIGICSNNNNHEKVQS